MKAHLLFSDRDLDPGEGLTAGQADLIRDLDLSAMFETMAHGDQLLFEVSQRVVLSSLEDPEEIGYRQAVLADCLAHREAVLEMYEIALEAVRTEKKIYQPMLSSPSGILRRSVEVMEAFVELLGRLRGIAGAHGHAFTSQGLSSFTEMLAAELDDEYFRSVKGHLQLLRFRDGIWESARLGAGNKGVDYVLRLPARSKRGLKRRLGIGPSMSFSFLVADRDEEGARALRELGDRGLNLVADALARSVDHILAFFTMLCSELGFYVACVNLEERLVANGEPVAMPVPVPAGGSALCFEGLYDVCLAAQSTQQLVGNDLDADGAMLVVVTGANSGGKSTFLRAVGVAQLMMCAGMYVGARSYRASACSKLASHFPRVEDRSMRSGKLDEELARMSAVVDELESSSMVLFNESFSSTNEREGSEIALQIVRALVEAGIRVVFVTHMFELADRLRLEHHGRAVFLRAERKSDGARTFKLVLGDPLQTSYGEDLYRSLGGW